MNSIWYVCEESLKVFYNDKYFYLCSSFIWIRSDKKTVKSYQIAKGIKSQRKTLFTKKEDYEI